MYYVLSLLSVRVLVTLMALGAGPLIVSRRLDIICHFKKRNRQIFLGKASFPT